MAITKREIKYTPGLIGKVARIIIPILRWSLPNNAFKWTYDKLYWMNKRRLWLQYSIKSILLIPFVNADTRHRQTLTRKLLPRTMGGHLALENAYDVTHRIELSGVKGDIVECGVAQGGTAAMMALTSETKGQEKRNFWFFDSFEGLPDPSEKDYIGNSAGEFIQPLENGSCLGTIEQVSELLFEKLKIPRNRVHLIQGWFQETISANRNKIKKIALLRLDGDWYESTKIPLDGFYDKIQPGGAVIIDDYATCYGSEKAVEEFLTENNISVKLWPDGRGGAWFIKPK